MRARKTELLDRSLSTLIRTFSDKVFNDTADLVDHILTPVKDELDRAGHKFSADFLTASIIYAIDKHGDEGMLDRIVHSTIDMYMHKFESELAMLKGVSSSTNFSMRNLEMSQFAKTFSATVSPLSEGVARRLVHASYLQWRKALGMPELSIREKSAYGIELPEKDGIPNLQNIRIGTQYELSDAVSLASKILKPARKQTDKPTYEFAHSFFVVVSLHILHDYRAPCMDEMLKYVVDSRWDCVEQMFSLGSLCNEGVQPKTKVFAEAFRDTSQALPDSVSSSIVRRSHDLWARALGISATTAKSVPAATVESCNSVQIFNLSALAAAATCVGEMHSERKGGAERLLKAAQENNGYRMLPDPKKARAVLEKAKSQFENLITPISYLQKNLVLSSAMGAKSFRVRPILLLGDPGIGKTYLAMALASSLGGSMEKVSAGGSGFHLNGSQSTWTGAKCGQVFKALAEGDTTSPVFIIDEIDKMGEDDRNPILPILLELLEPGTAATFKDEFFEINFDASRIIFILTANDLTEVPEALRSRVEIFDVPHPEPEQRLRIIKAEFKELKVQTGRQIQLDKTTSQILSNRTDIDMRRTSSIVRDAFVEAMMNNKKIAVFTLPEDSKRKNSESNSKYNGSKVGFLASWA